MSDLTKAGGVGALLQIADHPSGRTYVPTYDGNGNIVTLLNAATGGVAAVYEYSPFGEPLRAQPYDSTVADNPWRFSTKWTDLETNLVYYGHRYYDPSNGRFVGRDPIEETGGINLYAFCGNNGVNLWDLLGNIPRFVPNIGGAQVMLQGEQGYQPTGGGNSSTASLLTMAPRSSVSDDFDSVVAGTAVQPLSTSSLALQVLSTPEGQSALAADAAKGITYTINSDGTITMATLPTASSVGSSFNSTVSAGLATLNSTLAGGTVAPNKGTIVLAVGMTGTATASGELLLGGSGTGGITLATATELIPPAGAAIGVAGTGVLIFAGLAAAPAVAAGLPATGGGWVLPPPQATVIGGTYADPLPTTWDATATSKISKQMGPRGWTQSSIDNTVLNPAATSPATNRANGAAATAYFNADGSYVVVENATQIIIQVSNRSDPNWIPDPSITNPPKKHP